MTSSRRRRDGSRYLSVIVVAALFGLAVESVVGCSSDRPASSGDPLPVPRPPTADDASSPVDAGATDAPADARALDAGDADADLGNPLCIGDSPLADAGDISCSGSGCEAFCTRITQHYRVGVAQRARGCVSKLAACNDATKVIPCVDMGLLATCSDTTSAAFCKPIVGPCLAQGGSIDEFGCEQFANGLNNTGKNVFSGCVLAAIDAGRCGTDLEACADGIRQ